MIKNVFAELVQARIKELERLEEEARPGTARFVPGFRCHSDGKPGQIAGQAVRWGPWLTWWPVKANITAFSASGAGVPVKRCAPQHWW